MSDEILKAYGKPTLLDELIDAINLDPEIGFNPFVWISRKHVAKIAENMSSPAVLRYRTIMDKLYKQRMTDEIMIGQAFGL